MDTDVTQWFSIRSKLKFVNSQLHGSVDRIYRRVATVGKAWLGAWRLNRNQRIVACDDGPPRRRNPLEAMTHGHAETRLEFDYPVRKLRDAPTKEVISCTESHTV